MTVGHTLLSESEKLLIREVFTSVQDSGSLPRYICTYVLHRKLIMENKFLDKVENNAVVRTCISVTQNNLQELKEIWAQWDDEVKQLFYCNYGDLPYLLDIKVDEHLFRALA
ncbi:hypothetical protein Gotur_027807 [Gossypium turneri]